MAGAGFPVDMELKKAFQELQMKMVATQQQLKTSDMQIDSLKRQITHAELVQKEVNSIPVETKTYEGVGRMFILKPVPTVQENLKIKMKASTEKIKELENKKVYLEKNMKESENNIRELIMSKKMGQNTIS